MSSAPDYPREIGRYATLDGLRGAAALMVALFHLQVAMGVAPVRGYLAVDLFFGISGFVLCVAYADRFKGGFDPQAFLLLRIKRFYPLYACGFLLGLVALAASVLPSALGPAEIGTATLLGLLMVPNPTSYQLFPFNGAAWSLFFELVINVMLACWLWNRRTSELALAAIAALLVLLFVTEPPFYLNLGWNWSNMFGGAARTAFSFILGMLLFRAIGRRVPRPHAAAALIPLAVLLMALDPIGNEVLWDLGFIVIACPLILVAATATESPSWARPTMQRLGAVSYALYAIHWPLAMLMAPVMRGLPFTFAAALYLGTAVLIAHLLDVHVDRPLQSYFKRRHRSGALGAHALASPTQ